jgi:hypothetical protein
MQIAEYEHLQFLWGRGQSLTTFPAILGLLDKYSEVWSDAPENPSANGNSSIMTVPWISEKAIYRILELGNARIDRDRSVILVPNVSVAKALKSKCVDLVDYSVGEDKWVIYKLAETTNGGGEMFLDFLPVVEQPVANADAKHPAPLTISTATAAR